MTFLSLLNKDMIVWNTVGLFKRLGGSKVTVSGLLKSSNVACKLAWLQGHGRAPVAYDRASPSTRPFVLGTCLVISHALLWQHRRPRFPVLAPAVKSVQA